MPVGGTESGESGKGSGKFHLVGPPIRQLEPDLATARSQFCRYPEKPPANGTGHLLCIFTAKDLFLEPIHQVIGQHDQFEIEPGTCPMPRNTLVQTKSVDALLDKVLTAGTLVVNSPDLLARNLAVGGNHLIIIKILLNAEKPELLTRLFSLTNQFPNYHQAHVLERGDRQTQLACGKTFVKLPPVANTEDHPLEPYLLGYYYIELDLAHHQPAKKFDLEKATVGPEPFYLVLRQLFHYGPEKVLRLVTTGAIARTENSPDIVSCFSNKAHKRMVAGPATLLGIVTPPGPVLLAKDRYDVGVQIQGDGFHVTKSVADFIQLPEVDLCYMLGLVNRDPGKKTADRALGGKPGKTSQLLKYLVCLEFHHVDRPEDACHQAQEYIVADLAGVVVFFAPLADANCLEVLIQLQFAQEPAYEPCPSETGKIFASKFLFRFAIMMSLCSIFCHLFGAPLSLFSVNIILPGKEAFCTKNQ